MKLLFHNNLYVKQKVLSSGAVFWECDQRRNKFAWKAKLHVLDDQVIKQVNDHTHVASRAVVESSKVRQEMKKRARGAEETPQQIISQSVALLSEQAAVAMPPIHHIRRDIRRQRKRAGNPLPVPQDKDFDIPPEYHQTTSGQQFLLFDSGHGEERIIISSLLTRTSSSSLSPPLGSWMALSKLLLRCSSNFTPSTVALPIEYYHAFMPFYQTNKPHTPFSSKF